MRLLLQVAIAVDQLGNTLLGGWADETISARAWRQQHKRRWRLAMRVIDAAFRLFGQREHCRLAHEAELQRRQAPPGTRDLQDLPQTDERTAMNIPKDKLQHAAVGLLAALASLGLWVVASQAGLVPLAGGPGAAVLGALICGITKEGADWMANRIRPGSHGVELLDALATAAPGVVVGLAAQQVLLTVAV